MKERERILQLVKEGVLSTEDALDLLENLAQKETRESVQKDYSQAEYEEMKDSQKKVNEDEEKEPSEKQKATAQLEKELEDLSNEAAGYSVELDRVNLQMKELNHQLDQKNEKLIHLEALANLEELSEEKEQEIDQLEDEIDGLADQMDELADKKEEISEQLQSVKRRQLKVQAKRLSQKIDVPEDWKESATGAFNQFGETVNQIGSEVSKTLKDTFETVSENFDWTDVNIKVPSLTSTKLTHEFVYPDSQASILDFKIANGAVTFKRSQTNEIKIEADIKIYGKLEGQSPMQAFEERSVITENDEQLKFHVPNKRIRINAVVYLPEREYDYTAVNVLNGTITFHDYKGKDLFVKSTNGNMTFKNVEAVMLETKGTNGNVTLQDSVLRDVIVHTINGDVTLKGAYDSSSLSTVNGTVRVTMTGDKGTRLEANSVNGAIKISFPKRFDVEGDVHTNFGKIHSRLSDVEVLSEQNDRTSRTRKFRRIKEGSPFKLNATTTTGNILLKDSE